MLYYTVVCAGEMDDVKVNCYSLLMMFVAQQVQDKKDVFEIVGEVA
jgi:hypothetical protein